MAQITDVKDPGKGGLVTLTVKMNDGTVITNQAPRNLVATPEQAKKYLDYLENSKNAPKTPAPAPQDMSFLKGVASDPAPAPKTK